MFCLFEVHPLWKSVYVFEARAILGDRLMVSTAGHCLPDKAFSRCLRRDNMGTVEPCAPADVARIDDQPGMSDEFAVIDGIVISGANDGVIAGD